VQRVLIVLLNQTIDLSVYFVDKVRYFGVDFLWLNFRLFRWNNDLLLELLVGF
jgi:hypothetical protein